MKYFRCKVINSNLQEDFYVKSIEEAKAKFSEKYKDIDISTVHIKTLPTLDSVKSSLNENNK